MQLAENHEVPDDPSAISSILAELKENFLSHQTKDLSFRKEQLSKLIRGHHQMKAQFSQALEKDLGYSPFLSEFISHYITDAEMKDSLSHFEKWAKPRKITLPIVVGVGKAYIKPEPLGVALVLSAWNYPVYTALPFVAAAISAGNSVLLKPSELAPNTSKVLKQLFDRYMDHRFYRCIEGKVEVAKTLASSKFDLILFTGSTRTGTSVAIEAAKNLIPCILELGGKCPVIVDHTANLLGAARRILAGKFMNCGQTCLAGDHVYVHRSIKNQFLDILKTQLHVLYGTHATSCPDMGKIINKTHIQRLEGYLKETHGGTVLSGGEVFEHERFIQPTIIDEPDSKSSIMTEEIFGPILPIVSYESLDSLIDVINSKPKPLAVYCFSEDRETKARLSSETSSGSFVVNEVAMHVVNTQLPFGGVGLSGYGRYHGRSGFENCSNMKSYTELAIVDMYPVSNRFPPYTPQKQKALLFLMKKMGHLTPQSIKKFAKVIIGLLILWRLWRMYSKFRYGV